MWMREEVLVKIRSLAAANGGIAPGQKTFENETGIGRSFWLGKFWAKWSDAVRDAGLTPQERNKPIQKEMIFEYLAEIVNHYQREPTRAEFDMHRNISTKLPWYQTLIEIFGSKASMFTEFRIWLETRKDLSSTKALLPNEIRSQTIVPQNQSAGYVYLLKSGNNFKIGRGENLEKRVKQIKVALPDRTELVHAIRTDDPSGIEAYWHRRFDAKRANGEWFKLSSVDVTAFKRRKFQ
jgi:Meiotically up-regulated gene 113